MSSLVQDLSAKETEGSETSPQKKDLVYGRIISERSLSTSIISPASELTVLMGLMPRHSF